MSDTQYLMHTVHAHGPSSRAVFTSAHCPWRPPVNTDVQNDERCSRCFVYSTQSQCSQSLNAALRHGRYMYWAPVNHDPWMWQYRPMSIHFGVTRFLLNFLIILMLYWIQSRFKYHITAFAMGLLKKLPVKIKLKLQLKLRAVCNIPDYCMSYFTLLSRFYRF